VARASNYGTGVHGQRGSRWVACQTKGEAANPGRSPIGLKLRGALNLARFDAARPRGAYHRTSGRRCRPLGVLKNDTLLSWQRQADLNALQQAFLHCHMDDMMALFLGTSLFQVSGGRTWIVR
jgi:hypothetical protein